jgi:hypothetical protein
MCVYCAATRFHLQVGPRRPAPPSGAHLDRRRRDVHQQVSNSWLSNYCVSDTPVPAQTMNCVAHQLWLVSQ